MRMIIYILFFCNLIFASEAVIEKNASTVIINSDIENSNNSIYIYSNNVNSSKTFILPSEVGSNGQILITDGNGTTTWTTLSGSGSPSSPDGSIQFNSSDNFSSTATLFYDDANSRLGIGTDSPEITLDVRGPIRTGVNGTDGQIYFASNGSNQFIILETNTGMTGNQTQIYLLPENDGDINQGLLTDGNGNLSWGGDIKQGPVSEDDPDNINITNNPDNVYVGGGRNHNINNNPDNVVIFGGESNQISNNSENSGILGGEDHQLSNNQENTAIFGGSSNQITNNSENSMIAAGENNQLSNATEFSMIGAGLGNNINNGNSEYSIIFAGTQNDLNNNSEFCVTGAGSNNVHNGRRNAIWTGNGNSFNNNSDRTIIFGGENNTSNGAINSFISGGFDNSIGADNSAILAAEDSDIGTGNEFIVNFYGTNCNSNGNGSHNFFGGLNLSFNNNSENSILFGNGVSNNGRNGAVVFNDGSDANDDPNTDHELRMKFNNGYRFWTNANSTIGVGMDAGDNAWNSVSDSSKKALKVKLYPMDFIGRIKDLKIYSWNYIDAPDSIRNYGPMAQDFYRLFGRDEFGTFGTNTTIKELDLVSIFALGVQGTAIKQEENTKNIQKIQNNSKRIDSRLNALEFRMKRLKTRLQK